MQSVIDEMFFGKRGYANVIKGDGGYKKALAEVSLLTEKILQELNEKQRKDLGELSDAYCNLDAEVALIHYREGFKTGLLLAAECFTE